MDDKKIFAAISNQELLGEVERRVQNEGLVLPDEFVGTVVATSEIDGAALEEIIFKNKVESFVDPDSEMGVEEQLEFMNEFWQRLGMTPPKLSDEQKAKMAGVLEQNRSKRIVPTPLLDIQGRQDIADRTRTAFPSNKITSSGPALAIPNETDIYGQLLRNPDDQIKAGKDKYGLVFRLPDGGQVAGRTNFVDAILENGQAIEGENDTVWVYPVMDVRVSSPRSWGSDGELYKNVNPVVTPDSNLAVQLLHQAAGTPFIGGNLDFANEAVFQLDAHGNPKHFVHAACVNWSGYGRVQLGLWRGNNRYGDFGVRDAESGL